MPGDIPVRHRAFSFFWSRPRIVRLGPEASPLPRSTGSAHGAPSDPQQNQDALAGKASWFVDPLVRG